MARAAESEAHGGGTRAMRRTHQQAACNGHRSCGTGICWRVINAIGGQQTAVWYLLGTTASSPFTSVCVLERCPIGEPGRPREASSCEGLVGCLGPCRRTLLSFTIAESRGFSVECTPHGSRPHAPGVPSTTLKRCARAGTQCTVNYRTADPEIYVRARRLCVECKGVRLRCSNHKSAMFLIQ